MARHPDTFPGLLYNGEALAKTLALLPLAEIWRARQVCWEWHSFIDCNVELRQLMFIDAMPKEMFPKRMWYQSYWSGATPRGEVIELCRRPFVVNPVVHRLWNVRDGVASPVLKSSDSLDAALKALDLSRETTGPDSDKAFHELPLEDLLESEPLVDIGELISDFNNERIWHQFRRAGWRTYEAQASRLLPDGHLKDIFERDFVELEQTYELPAPMLREPNAEGEDEVRRQSWTKMFLTQPPIASVSIKHPTMPVAWKVMDAQGVRIFHVLEVSSTTCRSRLCPH